MSIYHGRLAALHYTRRVLAEGKEYQAVAVLHILWAAAANPLDPAPRVTMSWQGCGGVVSSGARMRQIVARLTSVDALRRIDGGVYALHKPPLDELDEDLRAQVKAAQALLGVAPEQPARTPASAAERELRAQEKLERAQRREQVMVELGRTPKGVATILCKMCGLPDGALRYSGKGAGPVIEAIDWLATTGATWQDFLHICKRVSTDKSEDRPEDLRWLFAPKHADYLTKILQRHQEQKRSAS